MSTINQTKQSRIEKKYNEGFEDNQQMQQYTKNGLVSDGTCGGVVDYILEAEELVT